MNPFRKILLFIVPPLLTETLVAAGLWALITMTGPGHSRKLPKKIHKKILLPSYSETYHLIYHDAGVEDGYIVKVKILNRTLFCVQNENYSGDAVDIGLSCNWRAFNQEKK